MSKLDDGEVLRTPLDKSINGLPRHRQQRAGIKARRPMLWDVVDTFEEHAGDLFGRFPVRFLPWAYQVLQLGGSDRVLHLCSGGLEKGVRGVRVDIRPEVRPDVVADARELPFADDTFDAVLCDPPWSIEYATELYGTDYPRPSALLREACRVLRPGRLLGFVHFLVPKPEPGLRIRKTYGVVTGCGYRIRALTVFQKDERSLFA